MRKIGLIVVLSSLPCLGCWLGNPYDPIEFCFESEAQGIDEGTRIVWHQTKWTIKSISQNDPAEAAIGPCDEGTDRPLPEWIIKLRDEEGGTDLQTRIGYTMPELEIPNINSGDLITLRVVQNKDPESFGFVIYWGDCPDPTTGECIVEMAADEGYGGRVLEDAVIPPFAIKRGEDVGRRNGDCGKQLYHQIEVRAGGETILLNPGIFDSLKAEEPSGQVDYLVT
ncbi:MAG: hypothetical protein JRI25_23005, partial [Deltaproteobacteria bacterium]|nr:hypothetical protein [Deltaproteobacteria bacterium]